MGFPVPAFDFKRPRDSIKEYFILLYLDLISSEYYNNGKSLLMSYYNTLYLWYKLGNIVLDNRCDYIPFKIRDKLYKFPVIYKPFNNVVKITDSKGNDLSEYAGPSMDFFGIKLTPEDIDCESVIISYNNGEDKIVEKCEVINI